MIVQFVSLQAAVRRSAAADPSDNDHDAPAPCYPPESSGEIKIVAGSAESPPKCAFHVRGDGSAPAPRRLDVFNDTYRQAEKRMRCRKYMVKSVSPAGRRLHSIAYPTPCEPSTTGHHLVTKRERES